MSSLLRSHLGVSIGDPNTDPFTHAFAEYLSGECIDYSNSTPRRFYGSWPQTTLAESSVSKSTRTRRYITNT
jgi:hypothetical protein